VTTGQIERPLVLPFRQLVLFLFQFPFWRPQSLVVVLLSVLPVVLWRLRREQ
jgi:hypothetical protein